MKKPLLNLTIQLSELKMLTFIFIRLRLYIKFVKLGLNMNCPISAITSPQHLTRKTHPSTQPNV